MKIIKYLIGIFLLVFVGGFFISTVGLVPDNAIVYVNVNTNEFYSPLSLDQNKVTELNLKRSSFRNAKTYGYKMNEDDKQNGYFQQEGRSLTGTLLETIGLLPKLGNWLY